MLQEKIAGLNGIGTHLQIITDFISFYETQANASYDPACASFLKNVADKKSIQLIVIERMLRTRGIEILPANGRLDWKNTSPALTLSERSLEDVFNFVSKQSLNHMKSLWFLSMENRAVGPVFKAMFDLEEDFLLFAECDYLHHLSESAHAGVRRPRQAVSLN